MLESHCVYINNINCYQHNTKKAWNSTGKYNKKSNNNKMMWTFPLLMETTFWALVQCFNLLQNLLMEAQ